MSHDLYRTVLYFDGRKGLAKSEGVSIELTELPSIVPLPKTTTEAYFYPQVRDYRLRELSSQTRDMLPPEIAAVMGFLAAIAEVGRIFRTGGQPIRRLP